MLISLICFTYFIILLAIFLRTFLCPCLCMRMRLRLGARHLPNLLYFFCAVGFEKESEWLEFFPEHGGLGVRAKKRLPKGRFLCKLREYTAAEGVPSRDFFVKVWDRAGHRGRALGRGAKGQARGARRNGTWDTPPSLSIAGPDAGADGSNGASAAAERGKMWCAPRVHPWASGGCAAATRRFVMHLHSAPPLKAPPFGGPKIALRGGDGMGARRTRGGGFQKWGFVPGPMFCVRTDVATKGAGTQILARKIFFHKKNFLPTYV